MNARLGGCDAMTAERSLWDPLNRRSARPDLLLSWNDNGYSTWSWDEWRNRSLRFAGGLAQLGVLPGDRIACLLTNSSDVCAGVLGVWLAGCCLVSVPIVSRGMAIGQYITQLQRVINQSEPVIVICDESLVSSLQLADLNVPIIAFQAIEAPPVEPVLLKPNEIAFIQYTSGSTSEPLGCLLSSRAIAYQLSVLARALDIDAERDTGVVWLPLSHDMGLFGCVLLTYWTGHRLVLSTPRRFLTQPSSWFEDCARYQATVSAAPNFALDIAARVATARLPGTFPMRRLVVGGERVEPSTLRHVSTVLGPERLRLSALVPAYGLAEAVLAVTMSPLDHPPTILTLDELALSRGEVRQPPQVEVAEGRHVVALASAGKPLPGIDVRVRSGGPIGQLVVNTPSMADGYLDSPDATDERFTSTGLLTGDLGLVQDGGLYITGRCDDLMSVAGRNIYARDLEASMASVPGVHPGHYTVVNVDRAGTPCLIAVVEPKTGHPHLSVMAEDIRRAVRAGAGVSIAECLFVAHGQLPKTPSGKVQRFRCVEMAADRFTASGLRVRL